MTSWGPSSSYLDHLKLALYQSRRLFPLSQVQLSRLLVYTWVIVWLVVTLRAMQYIQHLVQTKLSLMSGGIAMISALGRLSTGASQFTEARMKLFLLLLGISYSHSAFMKGLY